MAENNMNGPAETGAEVLPPGLRRYDFRSPRKLTQARRVRMGGLYSKVVSRLAERFSVYLKTQAETTFLGLEQIQAENLVVEGDEDADVVVSEWLIKPGEGRFFIMWSRSLAFYIFEKLLGGTGEELFIEPELTDFEKDVLGRVTQLIVQEIQGAWSQPAFAEAQAGQVLESKKALMETCSHEILLIAGFTLHLESVHGKVGIVFPYSVIKPWLEENDPAKDIPLEEPKSTSRWGVCKAVAEAPVTLQVRLAHTPVRLSDVVNLQVGDCLELNHSIEAPVEVYVNDRLKFFARMGMQQKQLAIQISAVTLETSNQARPAEIRG
jgi:flagellar motor switch protein FliM